MPGSGWRAGGPPERAAAAEEREVEDVGVAVGARLGAMLPVRVRWLALLRMLGDVGGLECGGGRYVVVVGERRWQEAFGGWVDGAELGRFGMGC